MREAPVMVMVDVWRVAVSDDGSKVQLAASHLPGWSELDPEVAEVLGRNLLGQARIARRRAARRAEKISSRTAMELAMLLHQPASEKR